MQNAKLLRFGQKDRYALVSTPLLKTVHRTSESFEPYFGAFKQLQLVSLQLEFTLRETTLVEDEMHNCESVSERIKECPPYIEEVSPLDSPFSTLQHRTHPANAPLSPPLRCAQSLAVRRRRAARELTRDAVERALNEQVEPPSRGSSRDRLGRLIKHRWHILHRTSSSPASAADIILALLGSWRGAGTRSAS